MELNQKMQVISNKPDDSNKCIVYDRLYKFFIKLRYYWNNCDSNVRKLIYFLLLFVLFWYIIIVFNIFNLNIVYSIKSTSVYILGLRDYNEVYSPKYLWKFGLAMLSDKHDSMDKLISTTSLLHIDSLEAFNNIRSGDVIWIRAEQLNDFIDLILPKIAEYFTLIIASNTAFISPLYYDENDLHNTFDLLINSKYLLYLFLENYDATLSTDLIDVIPIGFDFRTSFTNPFSSEYKLGHHNTPSQQEYFMNQILNNINLKNKKRKFQIYFDYALNEKYQNNKNYLNYLQKWDNLFGLNWKNADLNNYRTFRSNNSNNILQLYSGRDHYRKKYYRSWLIWRINNDININKSLFYIDNQKYNQYDGFRMRSSFIFSLSPFGNGLDCHRTYESLLFGNIVIVQTGPLDILYIKHDLPVIIINDYNDINITMLNYWYHKYKNKISLNNANTRYKLTNNYWINYIRTKTAQKLAKM